MVAAPPPRGHALPVSRRGGRRSAPAADALPAEARRSSPMPKRGPVPRAPLG